MKNLKEISTRLKIAKKNAKKVADKPKNNVKTGKKATEKKTTKEQKKKERERKRIENQSSLFRLNLKMQTITLPPDPNNLPLLFFFLKTQEVSPRFLNQPFPGQ